MFIENFIKLAQEPEQDARSKRQGEKLRGSVIAVVKQDLPDVEKALGNIGNPELAGEVESELRRLNDFLDKVEQLSDSRMQYRNYRKAASHVITLVKKLLDAQKEIGFESISALERAAGHLGFYENLGIKPVNK